MNSSKAFYTIIAKSCLCLQCRFNENTFEVIWIITGKGQISIKLLFFGDITPSKETEIYVVMPMTHLYGHVIKNLIRAEFYSILSINGFEGIYVKLIRGQLLISRYKYEQWVDIGEKRAFRITRDVLGLQLY